MLAHLMLMTSAVRWNDDDVPYTDAQNDLIKMFRSADPIRYALSTPVYADPGTDSNAATPTPTSSGK